ncbi:MAG: hypothetical protein ACK506_04460 [Pirellula sp.]
MTISTWAVLGLSIVRLQRLPNKSITNQSERERGEPDTNSLIRCICDFVEFQQ